MSYPYQGRSGSFSAKRRPPQTRSRFPMKSSVHPSRYVNTNVVQATQEEYQVQHSFEDFGLEPQLLQNVLSRGYTTPTQIQDQAIMPLMEGRDVVGIARTGTGKTAAFLLPLIHKIIRDSQQGLLVLAPTRELAVQIEEELAAFCKGLKIGFCLCIGGASLEKQVFKLRGNPHVVIGTPGRIKDLINRGAFDTRMFTNIVLDEVDRMLDIGFVHDIKFLISKLPEQRQSAFFSATTTKETDDIMRALLRDPVHIVIKNKENTNAIHQDVVRVAHGGSKIDVLHNLLQQPDFKRVIVFGRTKHGINKLEEVLSARGIKVSSIHGNKTQAARQKSLEHIKRGRVQVLLATDVAARGIDIEDVTHVINYDEPQTYEDYIHRIGRTARAGKFGKALTFVS